MMKKLAIAALAFSMSVAATSFAQQTNEQARQDAAAQAHMDHKDSNDVKKAAKAQKHADKEREKALNSHEAKDAAKAQDKADRKAAKID